LLAALMLVVGSSLAQDGDRWQPDPPPEMPTDWDWIQTTSGEWLKGEILDMYKDTLRFDSDEFDEVSVDWGDLRQIRTAGTMVVGMEDGTVAVGRLFADGDVVRVMGDEEQTFAKDGVLSITAGEPKEINFWDFYLSLGANYRTGNTEQTETTSKARVQRRTVKSRLTFDLFATYNVTDDVTATDSQRLSGTWDYFISKRFFVTPLFAEWYRDPFQNIESRYTVAVAAGYTILDTSKIDWQVSGGPGYTSTRFSDVAEGDPTDDSAPAFLLATTYDHEISKNIDFLFDYRLTFTDEVSGTYLHHLLTSLEFELTSVLDFDVTWVWDRIQDPRENADGTLPEQDDYRLSFMLGLDF
jgi:hypothetical protein